MWISSQNEVLPKGIIRVFGVLLGVMTLLRTLPGETCIQVGTLFTYLYNITNKQTSCGLDILLNMSTIYSVEVGKILICPKFQFYKFTINSIIFLFILLNIHTIYSDYGIPSIFTLPDLPYLLTNPTSFLSFLQKTNRQIKSKRNTKCTKNTEKKHSEACTHTHTHSTPVKSQNQKL